MGAGTPQGDRYTFGVEWRLIRAGTAIIESSRGTASLKLQSAGIVSSLFKIDDVYTTHFDDPFCSTSSGMDAAEGKRHTETKVTYDRSRNRASYVERDLLRNNLVLHENGTDIPNCVSDVLTGLLKLRTLNLNVGQTGQIPMSDGRKSANIKVEAQEREEVKTPIGTYKTMRYEAELMNGIIYARKGRAFIWISDDARRVPVQIRLKLNFPVGTVTLLLEKLG
jgi:hypothetical protein